jgi:hypothetical protein
MELRTVSTSVNPGAEAHGGQGVAAVPPSF